jgi:hypothetical protein
LLIEQPVESIAGQLGGNPEAYLAAIVMKFANERSEAARDQRQQTEQHIANVQQQQIERLRDAADDLRAGALIGAVGGVYGGLCTFGAGALSLTDGGSEGAAKVLEGLGMSSKAAGEGVDGVYKASAQDEQTRATAAGDRADAAARRLEIVEDDVDSARDLEKAALDFLDQVVEIRAQTDQSMFIRG